MKARKDDSALPAWFVAELLGLDDEQHRTFGQQIITALEKIDPDLAPKILHHPFAHEISKGTAAYPRLLARFAAADDEQERALAIDAIAEIALREPATKEVVVALEKILSSAKSPAIASMAARALACAKDESFLSVQHNLLLTTSPSELRLAARFLGYGKYVKAADALLELLTPDNTMAADAIIWALGEIGHGKAVPKLHALLTQFGMTNEVLIALGKIASRASVVRLTPIMLEGMPDQRELAAAALSKIARKHDGSFGDPGLDTTMMKVLEKVIDTDTNRGARFHAIVTYSLLGGHLDPKRILAALGAGLSKKEIDAVGAMLLPKGPATGPAAAKPGAGKAKPKGKRGV